MMRGSGFRVNKASHVYGQPVEYITPTTEAIPINAALKQGSTMGGNVGLNNSSGIAEFVSLRATTGAQATQIPVLRIMPTVEYIVPLASSETVISTTNVGNHVAHATSGTGVVASATGNFVISGVYNTSGADAQFLTGYFTGVGATTA